MIEEGEFPRRDPRMMKRMSTNKRAQQRRDNPLAPYRYRVNTGFKGHFPNEGAVISERVKWCREHVGQGNDGWNQRFHPKRGHPPARTGELVFLFSDYAHAMAFMMRWC